MSAAGSLREMGKEPARQVCSSALASSLAQAVRARACDWRQQQLNLSWVLVHTLKLLQMRHFVSHAQHHEGLTPTPQAHLPSNYGVIAMHWTRPW